jgi:UDP:flavonoid glycosyltransferase YjiC (YdhE family)
MRCLFACRPSHGHWHQLVPLARALIAEGHEVAFATALSTGSQLEALGFLSFRAGIDEWDPSTAAMFPRRPPDLPAEDRLEWQIRNVYASIAAEQMFQDLLPIVAEWRPDVIVRDSGEFGAYLAAEHLGLPHATVQAGPFNDAIRRGAAEPLNRLRATLGLPPDPSMETLHRYLLLYGAPPSFFVPEAPVPPTTHALKPLGFGDGSLPSWIDDLPNQPNVHFTLGTVANRDLALFYKVMEGLAGAPLNVIVTVGRNNEPDDFGALPENIYVESFIPHNLLLPRCDLVICHGGYNTILKSLEFGIPLVLIPLGADHHVSTRSCVRMGVAQVLDVKTLSPAQVRVATTEVLSSPGYRQSARDVAKEIAGLPGPDYGARLLVQLAQTRAPLRAA